MRRNFTFAAISVAGRLLVSTFLFLLLARLWGPAEFGTFSFVFSVSTLLMLIVDFGFTTYLLRELATEPDKARQLIGQGIRAKLLLTGLMLIAATLLAVVLGPRSLPVDLYALLLSSALLLSFAEFFITPLRALGRYDLETLSATVGNALQFVTAGAIAWFGGSPVAVAGAMLVARGLFLAVSCCTLTRVISLRGLRHMPGNVRVTLRQLWPYGVDGALTSFWNLIDIIAVRLLFGVQVVGLYAAGQKYLQGAVALTPLVANVMIPQIARRAHVRAPDTWRTAMLTGFLMGGIGVAVAAPLFAFPEWITTTFFGTEFSKLAQWLPWFGAILLMRYVGTAFGVILSAIGLQAKRLIGQLFSLVMYIGAIVVVAVGGWSPTAALASLFFAMVTMCTVNAFHVYVARRQSQ